MFTVNQSLQSKLTLFRNVQSCITRRVAPVRGIHQSLTLFNGPRRLVCIVGSGPAGFYTAGRLLKEKDIHVDFYEKLPVPYGLVRYGVAPDHFDVTNCISQFSKELAKENCLFHGNVTVGKDISLSVLRENYHAVILANGAWSDRLLGIPHEEERVVSARRVVGWYNGLPADVSLSLPLHRAEHVAIVGIGNVALDVARILLSPVDRLKTLAVPQHVLQVLAGSAVKRVTLIGRRGPEHIAVTTKELREFAAMESSNVFFDAKECEHLPQIIAETGRPRRRLLELVYNISQNPSSHPSHKRCDIRFLRSPLRVNVEAGEVKSLTLAVNRLEDGKAVQSGAEVELACDLVLRSVGYAGIRYDNSLPYSENNILLNEKGRVTGMTGVYTVGWAGKGPVGVIADTLGNSLAVAKRVIEDLQDLPADIHRDGRLAVLAHLSRTHHTVVGKEGAQKVLRLEKELGRLLGKSMEKLVFEQLMLKVATEED